MNLLTVIINHNCNENAIHLKQVFSAHGDTLLVDSGSDITNAQRTLFDKTLGNVYYVGMLNAVDITNLELYDWLFIIASDVTITDEQKLIDRLHDLKESKVGMYAPSVPWYGSNHPQMRVSACRKIKEVPFVDGFCFSVRPSIFTKVFPIDSSLNAVGWGVDIVLAFHTLKSGYRSVVDHTVTVDHRVGPNQMSDPKPYLDKARSQRANWYESLDALPEHQGMRTFRKLMYFSFFKNAFGAWLARLMVR